MSSARALPWSRSRAGIWRVWLAAWAALLAGPALGAAESIAAQEYQVKAAFLYNFTKFIEWPAERLGAADRPFVIGVLGRDAFRAELEQAVRGRRVNGRRIEVRVLRSSAEAGAAHLVFVARNVEVETVEGWPPPGVLVVGESEELLQHGGAIALVFVGDNLRFAMNIEAATASGLKVSAQLQKLAVNARKAP